MLFKSDLKEIEPIKLVPDHKEMPQLFRGSMEFAREQGKDSPAFLALLDQIERLTKDDGYKYTSIDIKTLMLMKGMYPCIPGWHCDDFYRPTGGQPDLENVEGKAPQKHYLLLLGDCSTTEFVNEDFHGPSPDQVREIDGADKPLYYHYDHYIDRLLDQAEAETKLPRATSFAKPNTIYSFGPLAFHRGSPATKNGWRTFIRVTRSNHHECVNEIRYQCNVYVKGDISW